MNSKLIRFFLVFFLGLATGADADAHHSFSANYQLDQLVELEGRVSSFIWRNPHCFLYMDVMTDDGEQVTWMLELLNTILATNVGWTANTFSVGDVLEFSGNPARTGAKRLRTTRIYRLADGFSYDITNRGLGGPNQTIGTQGL